MPEDLLDVDLLAAVLDEADLDAADFTVDVRRAEVDLMIAKGESSFLNYGLTPVSYTHLDVYKRQAVCCIWSSRSALLSTISA